MGHRKQNDYLFINHSVGETGIVQTKQVTIMAVNGLAPYVARQSASMLLTVRYQRVLAFHVGTFQRSAFDQCWEMQVL